MRDIKLRLSLWLVAPLRVDLGLRSVSPAIQVRNFIEWVLSKSAKYGIGGDVEEMINLFSVYNYTQRRFLDSGSTLAAEGVVDYDYLVVTSTQDEDQIRKRFMTNFDRTVEDIDEGR